MPQTHLDPQLFERLLRGEASPEDIRELAWHLMEACPDCAQGVEVDWTVSAMPEDTTEEEADRASCHTGLVGASPATEGRTMSDELFGRVTERVRASMETLDRQRALAPQLVTELLPLPAPRQRLLVHNDCRYQTLPMAELLLDRAWALGFDEPRKAQEVALLALEVAERVDTSSSSPALLADVRARAWALCGNFRRIAADLRGAEEAFGKAHELLAEGTGDLLERARVLTLESTLLRLQLRLDEAEAMLIEVIGIYRRLDEKHLIGRTMINQALLLNERGETENAIATLQDAQRLLEPGREPHLLRIVQHNLVSYLSRLGRYEEAMAQIPALRQRMIQDGNRSDLLRLRWQEGRIHVGLGHYARAEAALLEVRKGMEELEFVHEVAVVTLELAALYMRQRRTGEIRDLAAQMFPIFQSRDLHQEAIAALLLFQRAVEMDTLTLRMVEEVADVVRRSQEKPRPQMAEPS